MISDPVFSTRPRGPTAARITMADVAREASVSKATVSMALRGMPEISESTRKAVTAVARRLGYRADPSLSRIAASRWKDRGATEGSSIAFLDFVQADESDGNSRVDLNTGLAAFDLPESGHAEGARQRAEELGYGFSHHRIVSERTLQQHTRVLYHRGVQAVILSSVHDRVMFDTFPWKRFAAVAVGDHCCAPPVESITEDACAAMTRATEKVLSAGYRKIGLVLSDDPAQCQRNLICQGVFEALIRRAGHAGRPPVRLIAGKGDTGLKHWVREHRIDAAIGHSDQAFEFLRAVGPDRLAFASLCTDGTDDRCSGLVDPGRRLGQRSVDLVDQLLRRGEFGLSAERTTHAVAATWMDGKSLPHSSLVEETAPMANRARLLAVS